jgi:hypothetical protein
VVTELAASLPKVRRRKPLPPGFRLALAQVFYCHLWVAIELFRWFTDTSLFALALIGGWIGLAWVRPGIAPHTVYDVLGCVHRLRQYWRDDN